MIARSGSHKDRSDKKDFDTIVKYLTELRADKVIPGRTFGDVKYAENLLDSKIFDKAGFYRWISLKNKEMLAAYTSSKAALAISNSEV